MQIDRVVVGVIDIGDRLRSVSDEKVAQIAESMNRVGLINPITLYSAKDETVSLIAGAHRLAAAKHLGWEEIDAVVIGGNEIDAKLTEIDENLCRHELSATEIAEHLSKRKELWEAREKAKAAAQAEDNNGTSCPTIPKAGPGRPKEFASDAAAVTGTSKRDINRNVKRADAVCQEARDLIRNTKLDSGAMLDKLAKMTAEEQVSYTQDQLAALRDKEMRDALREEGEARAREAKALREAARDECLNFLCTMMNARDWARLIDVIERAGGSIRADQLRQWQAP
jgi:hypothetical protein